MRWARVKMSSREVFLAAAPLMYKVGVYLANAQCWGGHWNKQKGEFIKDYGVVSLCLCSDHIDSYVNLHFPQLGLAPAREAKANYNSACQSTPLLSLCRAIFCLQDTVPGLVIPACSNLRQRWFSNTVHIHTSVSPTAGGLAHVISKCTPYQERSVRKQRNLLSACSSTQMIYTGSSPLTSTTPSWTL